MFLTNNTRIMLRLKELLDLNSTKNLQIRNRFYFSNNIYRTMFQGYLFLCQSKSLNDCIKNKKITCSENQVNIAKEIQTGVLIFLLNPEIDTLIGPFTSSEEMKTGLQPGAWNTAIDNKSLSGNILVTWENLHQLKNATEKISFLSNINNCKLTHSQIQELLEELNKSPKYNKQLN